LKSNVITMRNVYTKYYGELRPALVDVSLDVYEGDFVFITGPNGAGKTTLLETILGLIKPVRGVVKLLGFDMCSGKARKARRYCSYLPQDFMKEPYEPFKALEVILMGVKSSSPLGLTVNVDSDVLDYIYMLADYFNVRDCLNKAFGKLSGGQQQKVLLIRALARRPRVLFLDEPFSSLDYESRVRVCKVLCDLNRRHSTTILMVSHDRSIIPECCSLFLELYNGRIVNSIRRS